MVRRATAAFARREEVLAFVTDTFRFNFVDPVRRVDATDVLYEYPNCDRDPLPRWSFGSASAVG